MATDASYATLPMGTSARLLRVFREYDDSRSAPDKSDALAWRVLIDQALQSQLEEIATLHDGHCSLDFFVYGWLKKSIISDFGEDCWQGMPEGLLPLESSAHGTRPAFDTREFRDYLNDRTSMTTSLAHKAMSYVAFQLEKALEGISNPAPTWAQIAANNLPAVHPVERTIDSPVDLPVGPSTEPSPELTPPSSPNPVDSFMDQSFQLLLDANGWTALKEHTNVWEVPLPAVCGGHDLGDFKILGKLVGGVYMWKGGKGKGQRYVRVAVPRWTYIVRDGKIKWSKPKESDSEVWLRKLWRMYALLWRWSSYMAKHGDTTFLWYLQNNTDPFDYDDEGLFYAKLCLSLGWINETIGKMPRWARPRTVSQE